MRLGRSYKQPRSGKLVIRGTLLKDPHSLPLSRAVVDNASSADVPEAQPLVRGWRSITELSGETATAIGGTGT